MIPGVDGQQQRTTLNHSIPAAQHRRLNVSVCLTVKRKEVGQTEVLLAISREFGKSLEWLLTGEE
jgi:hypothetical protein